MTPQCSGDSANRVELDQVFKALSHTARRRILTALMKDNPRREPEFETVEFRPEGAEQETVRLELHHSHLPQLDDAGFVDWERETGVVVRGEAFEDIRPLLELMEDHEEELPDGWP